MAVKHAFVSAKADGGDATLVQPSKWNEDHVVDAAGINMATSSTAPATPPSGFTALYARTLAARALPSAKGPSGMDTLLQPFFGRNKVAMWMPVGGTTTAPITAVGLNAAVISGTSTARLTVATNLATSLRRHGTVSTATAASIARFSTAVPQFFRGDGDSKGGFFAVFRWVPADPATVDGARSFVGMASSSFGNVNPSTLLNFVGVGTDAGETTLSMMYNDGAGAATKIALGANFPDHTLSTDFYELALFCAPSGSSIGWQVTRINTGDIAEGTITTDLPVNTTFMFPQFARNNNATALSVAVDLVGLYIETDN